ncbi:MAG: Tol-Pal system beta propeller repeat protein TolB [Candidatus Korobacteraceae bacterium]|jgi:TolB protein
MKRLAVILSLVLALSAFLPAQDWIRTGTGLGVEKIRLAAPDFKLVTNDTGTQNLSATFNTTLGNDLQAAGIFDMVSRSFYPTSTPGAPQEVHLADWSSPPPNASMLAFGNLGVQGGYLNVQGWLYDTKNPQSPQVLGKQYREEANDANARLIAHRFADEIIFRLGGGVQGIAETKLYFVSARGGSKEIWQMDYDGAGQKQLTHLGSIALSPHVSPDGSRVAFSGVTKDGWQILMYSLELGRLVSFPHFGGDNYSPAWSSDGQNIAFSSSRTGNTEIYAVSALGGNVRRLTESKGPDVSPTWNPKTNAQIAWVSGRTGLPQIYTMASDGTNVGRMTDQGYAVSPSWSPNGQFLVFAWVRHYGPGAPGASDIYIMDVASKQWAQLTHDGGRNDFPSWSPDGRHIVFQSNRTGKVQIWTMLADGSQQRQLTTSGENSQPNWSFK